jgi:RimJ/RimL family protein N-acetyltransferase
MRVEIRSATADDILKLHGSVPCRVRAFAAERDGELLAVGGLMFPPNDPVVAFVMYAEGISGKDFKVTLHKAGMKAMQLARDLGLRRVVAAADMTYPAAERWLARFGFEPCEGVWVWRDE